MSDVVGLPTLLERLDRLAAGDITEAELEAWLTPALTSEPLGAHRADPTPWDAAPHESRLFWRLVYLFVDAPPAPRDDPAVRRRRAGRVAACARSTGCARLTHELLPLVLDQERLCTIVERHARGVISRTGFLSVVAESGYAPHAKLWLERAPVASLGALCELLHAGEYRRAASVLESKP